MFQNVRKFFQYDHPLLKLLASLLVATLVVYPARDEHWMDILRVSSYAFLFLLSTCLSFVVFSWIYGISVFLMLNYNGKDKQQQRWVWQIVAGVGVSFLCSLACSELYFRFMGQEMAMHYGRNTLPMFLFIIVCANLIYIFYLDQYTDLTRKLTPYATVIAAKVGKSIHRIPVEQIAYVYHHNKVNWVRVFENDSEDDECITTEKYLLEDTLDNVEAMLNPSLFKKLNRKVVANKNAIRQIQKEDRGLTFVLDPPCSEIGLIKSGRIRKKVLEDWLMHCLSWTL